MSDVTCVPTLEERVAFLEKRAIETVFSDKLQERVEALEKRADDTQEALHSHLLKEAMSVPAPDQREYLENILAAASPGEPPISAEDVERVTGFVQQGLLCFGSISAGPHPTMRSIAAQGERHLQKALSILGMGEEGQ